KLVTHRTLLHEVWGPGYEDETHYLRVHIAHVRSKIEADPSSPALLITEPGVGYRLTGPSERNLYAGAADLFASLTRRDRRLMDGPAQAEGPAPHGGRARPVRHRLRQRRLLDLLRARARRRPRARAHAARLHLRRRAVRAHGEDLRRGRLD